MRHGGAQITAAQWPHGHVRNHGWCSGLCRPTTATLQTPGMRLDGPLALQALSSRCCSQTRGATGYRVGGDQMFLCAQASVVSSMTLPVVAPPARDSAKPAAQRTSLPPVPSAPSEKQKQMRPHSCGAFVRTSPTRAGVHLGAAAALLGDPPRRALPLRSPCTMDNVPATQLVEATRAAARAVSQRTLHVS